MNQIRISNAIIDNITRDRGVSYVTISYNQPRQQRQTVKMVVTQDTRIRDENGRFVNMGELQRGMIVDASISSAMTRSIPPQATAFWIQIIRRTQTTQTTVGRIVRIDIDNQSIRTVCVGDVGSMIQFNLAPGTQIIGLLGRPITLRDLWIGAQVRVEHASFMTASIPPQTTAYVIRVTG